MKKIIALLALCAAAGCASSDRPGAEPVVNQERPMNRQESSMKSSDVQLGNFSVSLAVKDIAASRAFYEKLGFKVFGGDQSQNWLIMQNDTATIGLFQGMFPKNVLTFNPGWDRSATTLPKFQDVRELQRSFKEKGLPLATEADASSTGPASLMLIDPDGNPILIDQHVPKPSR